MHGDFYRWYSPNLDREMDLLVFGHAGARVLVFPTSHGSYHEYRDRGMIEALGQHIRAGWLQVICVDSNDGASWYAKYLPVRDRVQNHLRYERYLVDEVLPFSKSLNANPYLIAHGCSFGAFQAALLGLRRPDLVDRVVGLSGYYDSTRFLGPGSEEEAYFVNPIAFIRGLSDPRQQALLKRLDIILAIGRDDASYANNMAFSDALWSKNIWHATRVWGGWSHDWPYWRDMVLHYIGGPDTR